MRLLLVEDNSDISSNLKHRFKTRFVIDIANDGNQAQSLFYLHNYQLMILDVGLPDINGLQLLQIFRREQFSGPILILTGFDSGHDVAQGFSKGADDYLAKPFSFLELEARLTNLIQKKPKKMAKLVTIKKLSFDLINKRAYYQDQLIKLRPKEKMILEALIRNANHIMTKQALLYQAWQDPYLHSNTLEVHINSLRQKIDKRFGINLIETVHGYGYTIQQP
jgi:DNA-binding response OmpR family regulator